jgi:hypothetical protein
VGGKKYFGLTLSDLHEHPIWVRSMDVATFSDAEEDDCDDDTGSVVPLPGDPALVERLFDNCICYARARFVAADGRQYTGVMKCWAGEGVECEGPFIATDDGRVDFYFGIARPPEEHVAASYARLGTSSEGLFPLSYRPDVSLPNGPLGGELRGFHYADVLNDRLASAGIAAVIAGLLAPWLPWPWAVACLLGLSFGAWWVVDRLTRRG